MQPTSAWIPVLALLVAGGLIAVIIRLRRWWWRAGAGAGLLVVGMLLGVVTVNDYYGYYQSWSALATDLGGGGTLPPALAATNLSATSGRPQGGRLVVTRLAGPASGLNRMAYVYLPPQYDQPAFAHVRFPVVELMHGSPGTPQNWVSQLRIGPVVDQLMAHHLLGPTIFVMPTINIGHHYSECLDTPGNPVGTYLVNDVRTALTTQFRASTDPQQWAIGGYSSGGYCAANLALRNPGDFSAAFALDGYFAPQDGPAAAVLHHDPAAMAANDPLLLPSAYRWGHPLPALWLSAGTSGGGDYAQARALAHRFAKLEPVPLVVERHAGHNFYAWAPVLPRALMWSWAQIAPPGLRHEFPIDSRQRPIVITPKLPTRLLKILAEHARQVRAGRAHRRRR